jgi:hypothetical protein
MHHTPLLPSAIQKVVTLDIVIFAATIISDLFSSLQLRFEVLMAVRMTVLFRAEVSP